ncbi:hypothetical protein HDU97_010113 [Phlyctochytrium planicorne]|nr:hypothetical protein HDU97_010113 [Phlyctochytrium planicorne]
MDLLEQISKLSAQEQKHVQNMIDTLKEAFANMALQRLQMAFSDGPSMEDMVFDDGGLDFTNLREYLGNLGISNLTDDMMNSLMTQTIETSDPTSQDPGEFSFQEFSPFDDQTQLFAREEFSRHGVHDNIEAVVLEKVEIVKEPTPEPVVEAPAKAKKKKSKKAKTPKYLKSIKKQTPKPKKQESKQHRFVVSKVHKQDNSMLKPMTGKRSRHKNGHAKEGGGEDESEGEGSEADAENSGDDTNKESDTGRKRRVRKDETTEALNKLHLTEGDLPPLKTHHTRRRDKNYIPKIIGGHVDHAHPAGFKPVFWKAVKPITLPPIGTRENRLNDIVNSILAGKKRQ